MSAGPSTYSPTAFHVSQWPTAGAAPSPSAKSKHKHLKVPGGRSGRGTPTRKLSKAGSSSGASTSRLKKRSLREASTSSPAASRPAIKRIREPTPIYENDESTYSPSVTETDSSHAHQTCLPPRLGQDASAPASMYPTTAAGPSSYMPEVESCKEAETSENGEGEDSVLFSENTGAGRTDMITGEPNEDIDVGVEDDDEDMGDETLTAEPKMVPDDREKPGGQEEPDIQDGEESAVTEIGTEGDFALPTDEQFLVERMDQDNEVPDQQEQYAEQDAGNGEDDTILCQPQTTIDLRKIMPPPADTTSHKSVRSTSSRHSNSTSGVHDQMTQVIEKKASIAVPPSTQSFVDLEEETYSDEDDQPSPSSYHSGDSDDYEMTHRPVLERTAIKRDIRGFTESLSHLRDGVDGILPYRVVDRLGEGTFSSVYLAHDVLHRMYSNEYWTGRLDDPEPYIPRWATEGPQPSGVKVALKKILVTSSPARIENELAILEALRGCRHVSQLITAFREEDQIIIVLPYHQSDDFRHFYRHMDAPHMRSYLQCLFRSLKDIHRRGIIHRDVKPANFLYDYASQEGVLVDFGLAERYCPPKKSTCQHAPADLTHLQGTKVKTGETALVEQAVYDARKRSKQGEGRVGFPHEDKRPTIKTNRAGTRGFRAPEVLLKCPDQTVAIDIWSAGVMLLSILTHKFPVFNSNDDIEALMEIAAIFGRAAMERCALLHNRTIISNVPTLETNPPTLASLVLKLNPHIYTPHMANPTPADAKAHIESIDQAIDLCQRLLRLDATKRLSAVQALKHPFLAQGNGETELHISDASDELLCPAESKCGDLHDDSGGRHRAYIHPDLKEMAFGEGIATARDMLCPEHEHFQQRFQINPMNTRNLVLGACEEADQEAADEWEEGDLAGDDLDGFVIERGGGTTNRDGQLASGLPLVERDVNAPLASVVPPTKLSGHQPGRYQSTRRTVDA
ncbi:hypothetical protein IAU60_005617 [Kwoniella sp. DSM 27419]